jgi:hypothetical protein
MKNFIQRHGEKILGVLSCFDRLRFRGSLRLLSSVGGVAAWLNAAGVLLKGFLPFVEGTTQRLRRSTEEFAQAAGRPVRYLESKVDKEKLVARIRDAQGAADDGLVAVLSTLETCQSFDIFRNRETHQIDLRRRLRKCLHYYFYFEDGRFGLTQVRLMTWFPFDVRVVLNGREWLARQLDAKGLGYLRRDNCFVDLEDFARAQRLADQQPRIDWPGQLDRLLRRVYPQAGRFRGTPQPVEPLRYYWSSEQTEWATDLAFRDAASLAELYPLLTRHGMETFQSPDVLRFLGHKLPAHGGVHGKYAGQIVSDLKQRPEGVRVKHRAEKNSLKMYDKFGTVLRVETTLNDPKGLKVYRRKQDASEGPKEWLPLRKSVADLARRAELSQSANERYLEALGRLDADTPLGVLTDKLCRPVQVGKRRHRGLRPFDPEEVRLLEIVSRGEYEIAGFRNRDVRLALFAKTTMDGEETAEAAVERHRQSGRVSRKLAMLRAHGLIKKIPRTHRYLLTAQGRTAIAALLAARKASPRQLTAA